MKQPEIRFNGFIDEWSASVLGDVLKIPAKIEAKVKSNSDLLTVKLHGGGVHQMSSNKLLKLGSTKYYVRKAGQLIYGKQNFFNGSMAIIPLELDGKASSGDVPVFDITGADSIFLYQKISQPSFYERTKDLASGTGSKRLHEKTVQRLPIQLPSLSEQQKIGALFSKYDAIISLREQKLAELNALKKGMLQQMFDDDSKPQVRFSGFNDEWEEKKLGEVADTFSGGTPSASNKSYYEGDIPFIRSGEILSSKTKLCISTDGYNASSAKYVVVGDILYALYGATSGVVGISQLDGAINQAVLAIRVNDGVDSSFVSTQLLKMKDMVVNKYLQGGQGNLSAKIVTGYLIQLPTLPEQQKIGQLFKHLDARISNEQAKIEQLKAQKQGLLQKMIS